MIGGGDPFYHCVLGYLYSQLLTYLVSVQYQCVFSRLGIQSVALSRLHMSQNNIEVTD